MWDVVLPTSCVTGLFHVSVPTQLRVHRVDKFRAKERPPVTSLEAEMEPSISPLGSGLFSEL